MELVSILIPCYNAERFVKEAVDSALAQDYPNTEVIVIDDGSTDGSLDLLRSYGQRIQLRSRENRGGNPTRNELLSLARGTWIQYLDADDYLVPQKISEQMTWIASNPGHDVVYGAVMVVYDDGNNRRLDRQEVIYPNDPWAAMVSWELPQTSSPLFRRTALQEVGGWNDQQRVCQEHELYLRLLKSGKKFVGVGELRNITHYRQWGDETISRKNPERTYLTRMGLMEQAFEFMKQHNLLTDFRREVYMMWCVLVSRGLWPINPSEAAAFFARNKNVYPVTAFQSPFVNKTFQRMVHYVGFANAERIASLLRKLKGR